MQVSNSFFYILYIILLVLPFALGAIQIACGRSNNHSRTFYRYFLFINMVFTSLAIGLALIFTSPSFDAMVGWFHTPNYLEFGVVMSALAVATWIMMFAQGEINLAPGFTWMFVLFFLAILHLWQVATNFYHGSGMVLSAHAIYEFVNVAIVGVLLYFMRKKCKHESSHAIIDDHIQE